nr:retrovirus-related Pol polyprotein from transposon TNT 1-94 [Tanacetum cinerariifolium]
SKKHDDKTKREAKGKSPVESSTGYRNLSANAAGPSNAAVSPTHGQSSYVDSSQLPDDPNMPKLEDITYSDDEEDVGAEADFTNLETSITISPIPTTKVHKDHLVTQINKTPYELLLGRTPSIGFMRPFGCLVTILNTLDPLEKFNRKVDEGFLVRYSVSSKAFRVFNSRTQIVQETLHINFLENKTNVAGSGPTWLFDIDTLTKIMNYQPVTTGNQSNLSAGVQETFDAPFWAKAVNTACYVQNRVLVTKPQNKTLYDLLHGRTPSIGFMRPFGCHETILNTLDSLEKFDGKVDEGFLVGYSVSSKAFKNTDGDAAFQVKEPEFEGRKLKSEVYVSPSSSAQSKKHDDKTKREAKGKSPVESLTRYRNLSAEFEDFSDDSINEVNAVDSPVLAVRQISTNNTNSFSAAGPSNAVVSPTHGKSSCII